jgi:hypothetical protein
LVRVTAALAERDEWVSILLGDLLPDWGEGATEEEAVADLADSVFDLHAMLHSEPDAVLSRHLRYQRDFLCRLARAFGPHG